VPAEEAFRTAFAHMPWSEREGGRRRRVYWPGGFKDATPGALFWVLRMLVPRHACVVEAAGGAARPDVSYLRNL